MSIVRFGISGLALYSGVEALMCSGSADPSVSVAQCYAGSAGALGLKESVHVKIDDFTAPSGNMELTGDGILSLNCAKHSFSKSGQQITTDLSDCLPNDVAVSSVKYCSDQDAISVTVKDASVPIPITAQLTRVDCASMEVETPLTCSGSADPVVSAAQCYSGSAGALGLTETVNVQIDDFTAPSGNMELTGDGILSLNCSKHSFSKSGQQITTDLRDCLPNDVTVSSVKYCSDQDAISVTVKDASVPIPITAQLTRVDCATRAQTIVV